MVVPNGLLQRWQADRLMNIELSFHVKDNSPSLQLRPNNVGQYVSFDYWRTATNYFDSHQAPARVLDDCIELFLFITDTSIAESRGKHFIQVRI